MTREKVCTCSGCIQDRYPLPKYFWVSRWINVRTWKPKNARPDGTHRETRSQYYSFHDSYKPQQLYEQSLSFSAFLSRDPTSSPWGEFEKTVCMWVQVLFPCKYIWSLQMGVGLFMFKLVNYWVILLWELLLLLHPTTFNTTASWAWSLCFVKEH